MSGWESLLAEADWLWLWAWVKFQGLGMLKSCLRPLSGCGPRGLMVAGAYPSAGAWTLPNIDKGGRAETGGRFSDCWWWAKPDI